LLHHLADWIVPERNPGGVIYGIIAIGALLAAESGAHDNYLETVVSALIAALLYTLAYGYSGLLGRRLVSRERLTTRALWRALGDEWSIVRGAAVPIAVIVVCWAAGVEGSDAINAALWSAVVCVVGFELVAGIRSHASPAELALEVGVGAALGLSILALKAVLG
jgi:hypothetical protein